MTIKRKKVTARTVRSIGWADNILEVEYISGLIHHYHAVSEDEFVHCTIGNIDKKVRQIGCSHTFTKIN